MFENEIFIGNVKGAKGDTGSGLKIIDYYADEPSLKSAVLNPSAGDAYCVGSEPPYDIYIYSPTKGWINNGALAPDINEQTPNYAEATTLETLTSGEKISLAFGKIKKAITDLISHLANKSNPHVVTAEQVGAVALGDDIVVGKNNDNNTTKGGIRFGIVYTEDKVPMVGMGTERGSNNLILTSGCDYTNETKWEELGEYTYYFPEEIPENLQSYPVVLKLSYFDGKLYFLKSANGKKHYTKNEIIPMDQYELLHSGNTLSHGVVRIKSGTYVGNGKYGAENPNILTFERMPEVVMISIANDNVNGAAGATATFMKNSKIGMVFLTSSNEYPLYARNILNWYNNTTLSWYSKAISSTEQTGASEQLNAEGVTYSWKAFYL